MFFKLQEFDRKLLVDYISKEPEANVFIIGDLENYGISSEIVEFFMLPGTSGWDCLVMRYRKMFIVYSRNDSYPVQATADFIATFNTIECISGKGSLIEPLAPYFSNFSMTKSYLSSCHTPSLGDVSLPSGYNLKKLTRDDASDVIGLYVHIEEFASQYAGKEQEQIAALRADLAQEKAGYGIYKDKVLVSTALTSAENSQSAMIIGVATHQEHRKKHLATIVMHHLLKDQFEKGKQFVCLFYNNPQAGRIYRACGFEDFGTFSMLRP
ncbi:MAG: hypothetical protein CVV52_06070 [Spirochaetae bacterium HGW-Spirochaetae-8]|jgi:hypothetical protein|nr:MAG: hypothetical protein CVV52_06070 [Spirochaetae bacterium HGW-Spirochaetae-8]